MSATPGLFPILTNERPRSPLPGLRTLATRLSNPSPEAVAELEKAVSSRLGHGHGITVANRQTAWRLLLQALEPGRILVPSLHDSLLSEIILDEQWEILWMPLQPGDLAPNLRRINAGEVARAKAAILSHPFGIPGPLAKMQRSCRKHGLKLIEDLSGALLSRLGQGLRSPSGDIAVCSFGSDEMMYAGGAVITTSDEALATKLRTLREALPLPKTALVVLQAFGHMLRPLASWPPLFTLAVAPALWLRELFGAPKVSLPARSLRLHPLAAAMAGQAIALIDEERQALASEWQPLHKLLQEAGLDVAVPGGMALPSPHAVGICPDGDLLAGAFFSHGVHVRTSPYRDAFAAAATFGAEHCEPISSHLFLLPVRPGITDERRRIYHSIVREMLWRFNEA